MEQLQEFREIFAEVKEILVEGYRQRGKEDFARCFEEVDVDLMCNLAIPFIEAELQKLNECGEVASL